MACAALLLFLLVPLAAGAEPENLVPGPPDLPATAVPSVLPSPEPPLKLPDHVDEVVRGVVPPPTESPPPTGGEDPGEDPPGDDGDDGGNGDGGGGSSVPGRKPDRTSTLPVVNPVPPEGLGRNVVPSGGANLPMVRSGLVWRPVSPSLGTLGSRARSLVAPLAAPMGLGVVAVMLLGLATRGPGVISKLNEELESADGRQFWRL
jgi:hypothetical protein